MKLVTLLVVCDIIDSVVSVVNGNYEISVLLTNLSVQGE